MFDYSDPAIIGSIFGIILLHIVIPFTVSFLYLRHKKLNNKNQYLKLSWVLAGIFIISFASSFVLQQESIFNFTIVYMLIGGIGFISTMKQTITH